jgi:drug/metabolite transporter (DMT)-like permease
MYCVFTTAIFYFVFGEQLEQKFVIGIIFMITCVIFVATPKKVSSVSASDMGGAEQEIFVKAIGLGLLAPLFISIFISVSRFWTTNYGYKS